MSPLRTSSVNAINSFSAKYEECEQLLEQASEHERVSPFRMQLIEYAERLVRLHPDNADAYHMLGLAWYEYPSSASFRFWRCRMALERATAIDPDHQYALQYLAYLAFDQERYNEALRFQARLRPSYFIERDQEWRALKNAETVLVCRMKCEPHVFPQEEFAKFRSWYLDARKREDGFGDGSYVPPQELREYAEWVFESGAQFPDSRLNDILTFLHTILYHDTIRSPTLRARAEQLTARSEIESIRGDKIAPTATLIDVEQATSA